MTLVETFQPGSLVKARGREWVVLPDSEADLLHLRPLGGSDEDSTLIYVPLEATPPVPATFPPPNPEMAGSQAAGLLLRDSLRLKLRAGAGPFRSFGNISVEPRGYQLVPLLMALKLDIVRLLVADDVGIGKTIEASLIARELLDRGEIQRFTVICPPHLCEQWQQELATKFNIQTEVVRTGTAGRLERGLPVGKSIFDVYPFTVVSLDYIKSDRRRDEFLRACPEFVIVEEAHTCVQAGTGTKHQRFMLLKGLAENPNRHMVMLTATPHSGDDEAFHNLLGLLRLDFRSLLDLPDKQREKLRQELALYMVQRRRPDIAEWKDATIFPDRKTAEATYLLDGAWGKLFDEVLTYARQMVERAEEKGLLQQRMNWWAALALLRCLSSSPAAASIALRTRLKAVEGVTESDQAAGVDRQAAETVLDGESDDLLNLDEAVPAGTVDDADGADAKILKGLIERADALKGPKNDPKLGKLLEELLKLVDAGHNPVVFCRYIATAHYVAEHLAEMLGRKGVEVIAVTGELASEEREEKVGSLMDFDRRLLVATDCLSEGINLQGLFDAVIHYDLSWNPTRHEQREGRVDRFGQRSEVVRALMLYGENNPVDGAVLRVILRKAEQIRKQLGVLVPLPADTNKIMQAIMEAVLLKGGSIAAPKQQLDLFATQEAEVETAWESAREKAKQSQTIFAQRRLRPEEVLPEWQKAVAVLGGEDDVERFVQTAVERLGAPLEKGSNVYRLPVEHLPIGLKERLKAVGITKGLKVSFRNPPAAGVEFIHRSHAMVSTLADHIVEVALAGENSDLAARSGAIFTKTVSVKTSAYLLRLRSQLTVEVREDTRFVPSSVLLSEECVVVASRGTGSPNLLTNDEALTLMAAEPAKNMDPAMRRQQVEAALGRLPVLQDLFADVANRRATELLEDHKRVRQASDAKGIRYSVAACLPVDVIGVYVLLPSVSL